MRDHLCRAFRSRQFAGVAHRTTRRQRRSSFDIPAEDRRRRAPTAPQRRAIAAVRKFPQGTAPAPRQALSRGRVQRSRAARRQHEQDVRTQSIGMKLDGGGALVARALGLKARNGASSLAAYDDRGTYLARSRAVQKLTTSLIAAAASAGTTLRAMKSSQFLNFALARASMIALERAGPICGSLSSSAAVAVLRLVLATCGAVAAPVVAGFAGAVTAGAGFADCAGCVPCAKAGTDSSASIAGVTRTRRVNIAVGPLGDPS